MKNLESLPNQVESLRLDVLDLRKSIEDFINSPFGRSEVIGVEEVSKLTGYSKNTVYQYVGRDLIPSHKPLHGGRKLVFYRSEIENWLRGKKTETSEEYCERKEQELINQYGGLN